MHLGRIKEKIWASLVVQMIKNLPVIQETQVWSLGGEDPMEKGMATHSSICAWRIPGTEKPSKLQPMGLQRVRHDWATNTHTHTKRKHVQSAWEMMASNITILQIWDAICCCSVTQSYPTLCDPMDCNMPGFPVFHYLLEFAQIHVHWVNDTMQPSHPLLPLSPPACNFSQHQGLFQWVSSSYQGQSIGASASASVLPMIIQGWFPLGLTSLISLQSKRLSRVFSSTAPCYIF